MTPEDYKDESFERRWIAKMGREERERYLDGRDDFRPVGSDLTRKQWLVYKRINEEKGLDEAQAYADEIRLAVYRDNVAKSPKVEGIGLDHRGAIFMACFQATCHVAVFLPVGYLSYGVTGLQIGALAVVCANIYTLGGAVFGGFYGD